MLTSFVFLQVNVKKFRKLAKVVNTEVVKSLYLLNVINFNKILRKNVTFENIYKLK